MPTSLRLVILWKSCINNYKHFRGHWRIKLTITPRNKLNDMRNFLKAYMMFLVRGFSSFFMWLLHCLTCQQRDGLCTQTACNKGDKSELLLDSVPHWILHASQDHRDKKSADVEGSTYHCKPTTTLWCELSTLHFLLFCAFHMHFLQSLPNIMHCLLGAIKLSTWHCQTALNLPRSH